VPSCEEVAREEKASTDDRERPADRTRGEVCASAGRVPEIVDLGHCASLA
jgi:hypothetical protein